MKPLRRWLPFALVTLLLCGAPWLLTKALQSLPEPMGSRGALFAEAIRTTLLLTLVAASVGLVLGLSLGLAEVSPRRWLCWPAEAVVWLVRGTPLLVQILFAYFALPAIFPGLALSEFAAGVAALALNVGAYNAEVVRAGILAVPKGQTEAAASLGLSTRQSMTWVVLPQALRMVVPALVNNAVALLKDSSLASAIGLYELSLAGTRVSSETFLPVPVLTTVAAVYLALTTVMTLATRVLEKTLKPVGQA